jgi:phosphoglycerol transferase MdoB-like AlkP superfamily enzyme
MEPFKILKKRIYRHFFLGFSVFFFVWAFIHRLLTGIFSLQIHEVDFKTTALSIFKQDALIVSVLLILYVVSSLVRVSILKVLFRLSMLGILLLYYLDLAAFQIFSVRLSFNDVFHYISDIHFLPTLFKLPFLNTLLIFIIILVFIISCIAFIFHQGPQSPKTSILILLAGLMIGGFHFSGKPGTYFIHDWMFKNFIEINLGRGLDTPYSKQFIETVLKTGIDENLKCTENTKSASQKNIVLLILESFSMYHSRFFSGINNYTPQLDRIAAEGRAFKNFISNGFTTEHGLIAFFTGKFPIPGIKESKYNFYSDDFKGYYDLENPLPKILARNGYYSEFLTSGHLGFSNKGEWLKNLGFDYIEGHEADLYKGHKRFHFQSVPDDVLYERVLQRLKEIKSNAPYFMAIETVSTHLPFIDPVTEERSEPLAIQFADTALGNFYDDLNKTDFFDNGILIVVSDHRTLNVVHPEEIDLFGPKAPALVPLIIIGPEYSGVEKDLFQQTDIFTSIKNHVSEVSCTSDFSGDLLKIPSTPPTFAVYVRGDDRSLISVFSEKAHATFRLEGDETKLIVGEIEDFYYIVRKLNYDRLSRGTPFSK